jgi:hypothetical protein
VASWKRSGQTGAAFAAQLGVKEATLRHWKWELAREPRIAPVPTFVEVLAAPTGEATTRSLELMVREMRVVVPLGFDEDTLRRVLRVLEER